ncbi:unnamed protein product [Fraxinus pennsylvanica]|uniref:Uncharacterized protein n=1 Tax=Fraxinus pennsylvanica TaxID=56036 RepID=A0AAD1Z1F9_9LAMI|nr:unnamed protein product [Fraxinus pennsylvanica]
MGYQIRLLMLLGTLICLAAVVLSKQGTSVYYARPYLPSACYGNRNQGIMIAGANPTLYDGGKMVAKWEAKEVVNRGARMRKREVSTRMLVLKMESSSRKVVGDCWRQHKHE